MRFNRRIFLQQAGLAMLTLGVTETWLSSLNDDSWLAPWVKQHYQTLAQPTARKLALLVGINDYPRNLNLKGSITDVELQQELLIHRFGFKSSDILVLKGQQATREEIEKTFIEHLVEQAIPGDVIVFHFSGYGSQVKVPQPLIQQELKTNDSLQPTYKLANSLIPIDGIFPTKGTAAGNDLLEDTLLLLARSLATDKVTMVLDTSYQSIGNVLQDGLRVRSFPNPPTERPSSEELAFQEKLKTRINSSRQPLKMKGNGLSMPGIMLKATGGNQIATEVQWNGFSAGLFTYALTQHLWQVTPASTVYFSLRRTAETVESIMGEGQQPQLLGTRKKSPLTYFLLPKSPRGAAGVITKVEDNGKTALISLLGLPAILLEHYGVHSLLTIKESTTAKTIGQNSAISTSTEVSSAQMQLQIRSREGLSVKANLVNQLVSNVGQLREGQLVEEHIRVLPHNLGLTVALSADLTRIERVDATSALANIGVVSSVVTAGEQAADCLLDKGNKDDSKAVDQTQPNSEVDLSEDNQIFLPRENGYGLFTIGGVSIPNTEGVENEAIKSAANRLAPKLETLLAAKLCRLTVNEGSSRLAIKATLETIESKNQQKPQPLIVRETGYREKMSGVISSPVKDIQLLSSSTNNSAELTHLPIGSKVQYRLENYSDRSVYLMLIGLDSNGNAIILYSPDSDSQSTSFGHQSTLKHRCISPGETLIIPQPSSSLDWIVSGPVGLAEIHLICSQTPFLKTLEALSTMKHPKGEGERVVDLLNPLEIVQALLQDLHTASAVSSEIIGSVSDSYTLDVNVWATLPFIYQVKSIV